MRFLALWVYDLLNNILFQRHMIFCTYIYLQYPPQFLVLSNYRIVLSKRPWALAAQVPKFGVGTRRKCLNGSTMWAQWTYLWIHYARISMVGCYMENPETPQNCQKWGVGACTGMGACSGQYGMYLQCMYNVCLSFRILLHSSFLPFSHFPFFPHFFLPFSFFLPLSPISQSPLVLLPPSMLLSSTRLLLKFSGTCHSSNFEMAS